MQKGLTVYPWNGWTFLSILKWRIFQCAFKWMVTAMPVPVDCFEFKLRWFFPHKAIAGRQTQKKLDLFWSSCALINNKSSVNCLGLLYKQTANWPVVTATDRTGIKRVDIRFGRHFNAKRRQSVVSGKIVCVSYLLSSHFAKFFSVECNLLLMTKHCFAMENHDGQILLKKSVQNAIFRLKMSEFII